MLERLAKLRDDHKSDKGFTLIELLIVIIILGVLAAIVVFSVQGITDKGATNACKASVATVDTAAEALIANTPGTPPSIATITLGDLHPNYLHSVPTKIGGTTVGDTTTVATVDAITC